MEELELVSPAMEYKEDVLKFFQEIKEADASKPWQYAGMSRLNECSSYEVWIKEKKDEECGVNLPDGYVPASTFLCVRKIDNKVVGICNIRHQLNDFLLNYAGHIGQSIRPEERGKGYGARQLLLALDKCDELGMQNVLITCDETNIASAKTIEKCMGEYENTVQNGDSLTRRYWISIDKIKKLKM